MILIWNGKLRSLFTVLITAPLCRDQNAGPQEDLRRSCIFISVPAHILQPKAVGDQRRRYIPVKGQKGVCRFPGELLICSIKLKRILNAYGITMADIHPYYMNYSESAEAPGKRRYWCSFFQTGGGYLSQVFSSQQLPLHSVCFPYFRWSSSGYYWWIPIYQQDYHTGRNYEHQSNESDVQTLGYATTIFCSAKADRILFIVLLKVWWSLLILIGIPMTQHARSDLRQLQQNTFPSMMVLFTKILSGSGHSKGIRREGQNGI